MITTRRLIYGFIIILVSNMLMTVAGVIIAVSVAVAKSNDSAEHSDRRWCAFVNFMDSLSKQPANEPGEEEARQAFIVIVSDLKSNINC